MWLNPSGAGGGKKVLGSKKGTVLMLVTHTGGDTPPARDRK